MTIFGTDKVFDKKFKFIVEIDGVESASFQSVSDVRSQIATVEHYEGGALRANKSKGRVSHPRVTLRRGRTRDMDLWNWFQQGVSESAMVLEQDSKRTLDIVQQRRDGVEIDRITLFGCQAMDYKPGDWDNEADAVTIEEVILEFDYFERGGEEFAGLEPA